jgi:prepilin peptidase CpaA
MPLQPPSFEVVVVVLSASLIASLTDIWRFKVYNILTFPLFFCGIAYHTISDGWSGLGLSAAGAAFGLVVFLVPFALGGMGAGDVKFVAALGAWLGLRPLAWVVVFGCIASGIFAIGLVISNVGLRGLWFNLQLTMFRIGSLGGLLVGNDRREHIHNWTSHPERRKRLIPFSAMITIGLLVTVALMYAFSRNAITATGS